MRWDECIVCNERKRYLFYSFFAFKNDREGIRQWFSTVSLVLALQLHSILIVCLGLSLTLISLFSSFFFFQRSLRRFLSFQYELVPCYASHYFWMPGMSTRHSNMQCHTNPKPSILECVFMDFEIHLFSSSYLLPPSIPFWNQSIRWHVLRINLLSQY